MKNFTYNGENYSIFPYSRDIWYRFEPNTGILTVFSSDGVVGTCEAESPLFVYSKLEFEDEEVLLSFAGNTDKTITEILSDLDIDVSEMNDFLIVRIV